MKFAFSLGWFFQTSKDFYIKLKKKEYLLTTQLEKTFAAISTPTEAIVAPFL